MSRLSQWYQYQQIGGGGVMQSTQESVQQQGAFGGGAASGILFTTDFTQLTAGVPVLPAGYTWARASVATVQTGTSTIDITPGVNDPRAGRRLNAWSTGLVIEDGRINKCLFSRNIAGAAWTAGTAATTAPYVVVADPNGTFLACRSVTPVGGFSNYQTFGGAVADFTLSEFARGTLAALTHQITYTTPGVAFASQFAIGTTWERVELTPLLGAGAPILVPVDSEAGVIGGDNVARDALTDFVQIEQGGFATEPIVTDAVTVTRAGDQFRRTVGADLVSGDRISMYARLRPKGASTKYGANGENIRLWTDVLDATSYVEIAYATGVMTISIAGVTNTTAALAWSQFDELEVFVGAGASIATVVSYRVNAGATVQPAVAGAALGNFAPAGAIDLFCDGVTKQFTSWVYELTFYLSGFAPSWV